MSRMNPRFPGELFEIAIEGVAQGGRGMGRLPAGPEASRRGLAVFVEGALPGQKVLAAVRRRAENYLEADAVSLLEAAPEQVRPFCPHFGACGGCPWQILPYARQLELKAALAREALLRIGKISPGQLYAAWLEPIAAPGPRLACRNRMTFAFGREKGGRISLGQRGAASHSVVDIAECPILAPGHADILAAARALAQESGLPAHEPRRGGFWRSLTLRLGRTEQGASAWWGLLLTGPGERAAAQSFAEALLAACPGLHAIAHEERSAEDSVARGRRAFSLPGGKGAACTLRRRLGGREFLLDAGSFFQVNDGAAEELALLARSMTPSGRLLDVFCGVGAPGLLLEAAEIIGLDSDRRAIEFARANAAHAGASARYMAGDAGKILHGLSGGERFDAALLDPPRAGLDRAARRALSGLAPGRISYISCNPASLARDLRDLCASGYVLERIGFVDMFPHTHHLEACAALRLER